MKAAKDKQKKDPMGAHDDAMKRMREKLKAAGM